MPVITNIRERRKGTWVELFAQGEDSIRLPVEFASGTASGDEVSDARWAELKRVHFPTRKETQAATLVVIVSVAVVGVYVGVVDFVLSSVIHRVLP